MSGTNRRQHPISPHLEVPKRESQCLAECYVCLAAGTNLKMKVDMSKADYKEFFLQSCFCIDTRPMLSNGSPSSHDMLHARDICFIWRLTPWPRFWGRIR